MRNLLIQLEELEIPHFVVKSHIYAPFEPDEYRAEYHVYHVESKEIGKFNLRDVQYQSLKYKILSRNEIKFFHANQNKYKQVNTGKDGKRLDPKNGKIWVNVKLEFNPNIVKQKTISNNEYLRSSPNLFS